MNAVFGAVYYRVLEAVLNGVAQGLIVAGILWLTLKLARHWNAATRHAVAFGGLLIVAALPVLHLGQTFWTELRDRFATSDLPEQLAVSSLGDEEPLVSFVPVALDDADPLSSRSTVSVARALSNPVLPASPAPWRLVLPAYLAAALVACWSFITLLRLAGLARQCFALRRVKRESIPPVAEVRERFETLRGEIGRSRAVRLGLAHEVRTPIAAGFLHPMVLIPEALEAEPESHLDAILRHELAHLKRWDDWTNLVQQALQALFFFHPGVWCLAHRLGIDREIACDDYALASIGNRRAYALLLTEFASRTRAQDWVAAPGAWSKKGQLKERITMIMNAQRNASPRLARASAGLLTLGAALVALLVMQAGPRVALAEDAPSTPRASSSSAVSSAASADSAPETRIVAPNGSALTIVSGPKHKEHRVIVTKPAPPGLPAPELAIDTDVSVALAPDAAPPEGMEPPRPPRPANRNRDLEKRLDRLEQMVENLSRNKDKSEHREMHFEFKHPELDGKIAEKMAKLQSDLHEKVKKQNWNFNNEDWKKMEEDIRRSADQAAKEGDRIAREVVKNFERNKDIHQDAAGNESKARRKALEAQRKALEKQLQSIERQLEDMERQKDRADQERDRAEQERDRANQDRARADEARMRAEEERGRARDRADRERERSEREQLKSEQKRATTEEDKNDDNKNNDDNAPKKRKP